jgi:magnesium transporter
MTQKVRENHIKEIRSLLEVSDRQGIEALLATLHASDIASILGSLEEKDAVELFGHLTPERASETLLEVDERLRKSLISSISPSELIEVVHEMETDDAADVISELPAKDAEQVLQGIGKTEAIEVQKLLVYPEDSAGGKMQAELVSVPEIATIDGAIEELRKKSKEIENISSVFVVDSEKRLVGSVSLNKLILADPKALVTSVAEKDPQKVRTDTDQEEVAKLFQRYDLLSMPVVDAEGRLVGRITVDDVVDVIEEEIFEDFYKMAGLNLEERVLDPARRSIWMRLPWLLVNLGTAFLAASVVKVFQGTIERLVLLAVLMPIVAGMGGNAATQTITVVVRGLALGELSLKNAKRVLLKEASVGLANGVLTGAVATVIAYALGARLIVGLLLFLAMSANLLVAGLSGAFIPIVLKWFKVDPAISSSIFVTTCTDIGGFFTFLGLATVFMKMGLL